MLSSPLHLRDRVGTRTLSTIRTMIPNICRKVGSEFIVVVLIVVLICFAIYGICQMCEAVAPEEPLQVERGNNRWVMFTVSKLSCMHDFFSFFLILHNQVANTFDFSPSFELTNRPRPNINGILIEDGEEEADYPRQPRSNSPQQPLLQPAGSGVIGWRIGGNSSLTPTAPVSWSSQKYLKNIRNDSFSAGRQQADLKIYAQPSSLHFHHSAINPVPLLLFPTVYIQRISYFCWSPILFLLNKHSFCIF